MVTVKEVFDELVVYLLAHEDDIALCINDFGQLKNVFEMFIGRKPLSKEDKDK